MINETTRGAAGGRRRRRLGITASAWTLLLLVAVALPGCDLSTPTDPNSPSDLTGQATNQQFTFNGTITVTVSPSTVSADDLSAATVTAEVRDPSGNPVPNLTTVTFSTNLGAFQTTDSDGNPVLATAVPGLTFNGVAQAALQSFGRSSGTATVTAQIGTTYASTQVSFEPAPLKATISASFGTSGTGTSVDAGGEASAESPYEADVSALVTDTSGATTAPLVGGTVRFRIVRDTTQASQNGPAKFLLSGNVLTGSTGIAVNKLRVYGAGDVVVAAELIDPNTGAVAAVSNQIFTTTTLGSNAESLALTFADDSTNIELSGDGTELVSTGLQAVAKDASGATLSGYTVRFTIKSTSAAGAYLGADVSGSPVTATTSGDGVAITTLTLSAGGQIVVIGAELLDSGGNVIAVATDIIATYVTS